MNRTARILLLLLATLGLAVSIYLTVVHYRLMTSPEFESACKISDTIDCDKVNSSPYGKVFGIPLGLYGAGFYAVIFALSLFSFSSREKMRRAPELIFGLSSLAVLVSIALASISAFKIGAWCLFCVSLYVINLALLGFSFPASGGGLRAMIGRLDQELSGFYRSPLVYSAGLIFFGVTLLGNGVYQEQARAARDSAAKQFLEEARREQRPTPRPESATAKAPPSTGTGTGQSSSSTSAPAAPQVSAQEAMPDAPVQIPLLGHEAIRGRAGAPIQLVVFSDFQCPYCRVAAALLEDVAARFPGQVAVIYKHYPLDMDCNANMMRPLHEFACEASVASICAQRQGQFWEMHDLIFRNQEQISDITLTEYAKSLGLDMNAFSQCVKDRENDLLVSKDIESGRAVGITGTPAIFLNGRKWRGPFHPDTMAKVIQELLDSGAAAKMP